MVYERGKELASAVVYNLEHQYNLFDNMSRFWIIWFCHYDCRDFYRVSFTSPERPIDLSVDK